MGTKCRSLSRKKSQIDKHRQDRRTPDNMRNNTNIHIAVFASEKYIEKLNEFFGQNHDISSNGYKFHFYGYNSTYSFLERIEKSIDAVVVEANPLVDPAGCGWDCISDWLNDRKLRSVYLVVHPNNESLITLKQKEGQAYIDDIRSVMNYIKSLRK